jgi:hypothetical protein
MLLNTAKQKTDFTRINKLTVSKSCKGVSLETATDNKEIEKAADFGNMSLAALDKKAVCISNAATSTDKHVLRVKEFIKFSDNAPVAVVGMTHNLKPGQEVSSDFIFSQ